MAPRRDAWAISSNCFLLKRLLTSRADPLLEPDIVSSRTFLHVGESAPINKGTLQLSIIETHGDHRAGIGVSPFEMPVKL
jgi:hypothetical protein